MGIEAGLIVRLINSITGLIQAGSNVTISGNGTATSPYKINSSGGGGGGGGFTNTAVSNGSPYTAATGQTIFTIYNTSGSAYTFNLPASPAANDVYIIIDAELTAGAHPITVQGNGNTIIAGGTSGSSYEIGSNGGAISLAWDGTNVVQFA